MNGSHYLRTLGATELDVGFRSIPLSTREAALLAFLCSKRHQTGGRKDLANHFWPNATPARARHSLSQLLYALKPRLPSGFLIVTGDNVGVANCHADYLEVTKDILDGRPQDAVLRYNGRFLPKDDLSSAALSDWRDQIEADVATKVSHALQEQACACGTGELQRLMQVANEILTVHPHMTAAQIALLESMSRLGDNAAIERLHKQFASDSLGDLPPLQTFLSRRASPHQVSTVRFAGREAELKSLQQCWTEAETGVGQVAVILGEPGIGKTRLADHFLRRVAIRGGTTWIARCCAATQRLPYSVVEEFLRENGELGDNAGSVNLLEGLLLPTRTSWSETASDERRYQLTEYLTSMVISAARSQPLVVFLDDAQWADDYTALLLSYWAYRLRGEHVMILLTVRTEEADPLPTWVSSDLGRFTKINLGRISVEAASNIVDAFRSSNDLELDSSLRDAVLWQSAGRPFLLLEALTSLVRDGAKPTVDSILTESAENVLRRRFRNLSDEAAAVLGAMTVCGQAMEASLLQQIAVVPEAMFATAIDELHRRGIAYWDNGVVRFPHDLMREAAYRHLMPATRALYHKRAAESIRGSGGPAGLIATHFSKAGDSVQASEFAVIAAEEALSTHLYKDYEFYSDLVIRHGTEIQRSQAAVNLSHFLIRMGRTGEVDDIRHYLHEGSTEEVLLREISELERELSGGSAVGTLLDRAARIIKMAGSLTELTAAPVVATLIDIAFDAGADEFGLRVAEALLPKPSSPSTTEAQIAIQSIISVWRGVTQNNDVALRQAKESVDRLSANASPSTEALCRSSYGTLLLLSARITEAKSQFQAALKLAAAAGDLRRQLCVLNNNGIALLESGDLESARAAFQRVLASVNVQARIRGYSNLAILHYELGDYNNAAAAAEGVLAMNASYKSPALEALAHALLGLACGQTSIALGHIEAVRRLGATPGGYDPTYSTLLVAKHYQSEGADTKAMSVLETAIQKVRMRDIPCVLRLRCEKAAILSQTDPRRALETVDGVIAQASAGGARLIEHRARDIRRTIRRIS